MSFGTVSFEELLGHCNQIYKSNQEELLNLQDRLADFGYVPGNTLIKTLFFSFSFFDLKGEIFGTLGVEIDEEESDSGAIVHDDDEDTESPSFQCSLMKRFDEEDLYPFCTMLLTNILIKYCCCWNCMFP